MMCGGSEELIYEYEFWYFVNGHDSFDFDLILFS